MAPSIEEPHGPGPTQVDAEKGQPITRVRTEEDEFPDARRLVLIMVAVYLSMFLVALDRTILGTAVPKITDDFHSIGDVGWYASVYLLLTCAFQLIYGRIYTFYSPKWVLLCAIGIFELGSAVCGAAPTSKAFIIGRAIAGLGAAGIFSGSMTVMIISIPLHKRPMFQGIFGAIFGVASVAGPLIGGAFTTKVSWRWCFYINLPIGALVVLVLLFILKSTPSKNTDTLREQVMKLDPYGTAFFLPGIVCLLLPLQWGGTTYPWGNPRIIVLFVLAAILIGIFTYIQFHSGDKATVPIRIIKQRSVAAGVYFSAVSAGAMLTAVYFLPIWFQAIKGVSAVRSGIDTLPLVMSLVVASIIAGVTTAKTGYYVGQLYACSIMMSIGAGLLTTLKVDSSHAQWIGYQVLFGFGLGLGMQQAGMAAQTCLNKKDVMTGVSLMFFFQGLGGSIFITIGQTVLSHSLIKRLEHIADLHPASIINTGATELRTLVPPQYLDEVLVAYNAALSDVLKVGMACAAATIVAALAMEWKSIKGLKQGGPSGEAAARRAQEEKTEDTAPASDTSRTRTPDAGLAQAERQAVEKVEE